MNPLAQKIQSLLFYLAQPLEIKEISRMTGAEKDDISAALNTLESTLKEQGIRLLRNNETVTLVTAPESSDLIERIEREELEKDLSKASLETLAIVLYKGPLTRSEIDYIRGVNSNFILRNLMIRGLVEKIDNPNDQRSFLYRATNTLLEHMGVANIQDLPGYKDAIETLSTFLSAEGVAGRDDLEGKRDNFTGEESPKPEQDETTNDSVDQAEDRELANDNYEDADFSSRTHHD